MRGRFITLEGGEGAGKTTQAKVLAERLRRKGINVLLTREPGGTPRAEAIREVLLSGKAKRFGALGEAVLFYAARESHLELGIRPALERGTWVICDRFSDSTRAYQGAAGGLPLSVIETIDKAVVGGTRPDLTLIFDLPPELGLKRAAERLREGAASAAVADERAERASSAAEGFRGAAAGSDVIALAPSDTAPAPDRFETMNLTFHRSLRAEFLAIAKAEPERCAVVDASDTSNRVEDKVWSIVRDRFQL
ncbi:dTMP kinase [Rhodomicrobium vannielii ATCC 17100]|uniref:dTMP kinase n=1 Tax=Rhodomicrobium vannielii TaxID=1069 RepID=UPI00191A47B5|nr:dTMP kinase [Rhodomicrobium vannielii ATCC 17100]